MSVKRMIVVEEMSDDMKINRYDASRYSAGKWYYCEGNVFYLYNGTVFSTMMNQLDFMALDPAPEKVAAVPTVDNGRIELAAPAEQREMVSAETLIKALAVAMHESAANRFMGGVVKKAEPPF